MEPALAANRQTARLAPRFRLTLRTSLTYSEYTGETYAATWSPGAYDFGAGSLLAGLAPVAGASTVTPARLSASMRMVRAYAAGSSIWKT